MLLTAIKEMRSGKGASVNAIFTYIRATYGYDLLKNRNHIKKTLAKLIDEGLVHRVKGRGLAGSFRLGKNYKDTKKTLAGAPKPVRMKSVKDKCLMRQILLVCIIELVSDFSVWLELQKHREHAQENVSTASKGKGRSSSAKLSPHRRPTRSVLSRIGLSSTRGDRNSRGLGRKPGQESRSNGRPAGHVHRRLTDVS